jgi:chorismate mutase/prephenate dehydratase
MSDAEQQLDSIRAELDALDERLISLINSRARLVQRIGETKASAGMRVYAPDRERQVLDRIAALNQGPIDDQALRVIYRELMSASLVLERTPRIAVLGPPGSYSHLAARRRFGLSVEFEAVATIPDVFDEIRKGHAEFAVVPVENSTAGGVGETIDALIDRDVKVCGEILLAVHHHLLSKGSLEAVERVYSNPVVFTQCHNWLAATGLLDKTAPALSTSAAAERAAGETNAAAIASELAGELYGLSAIAEYIEDDPGNITRFLIIGTVSPKPTDADKTSIVFGVGHKAGMLADALDVFRAGGINMTRIESRPNRSKPWEHYFLVDIEGHADTPQIAGPLEQTAVHCSHWKILGSYPRAAEVV